MADRVIELSVQIMLEELGPNLWEHKLERSAMSDRYSNQSDTPSSLGIIDNLVPVLSLQWEYPGLVSNTLKCS